MIYIFLTKANTNRTIYLDHHPKTRTTIRRWEILLKHKETDSHQAISCAKKFASLTTLFTNDKETECNKVLLSKIIEATDWEGKE